MQAENIQLTFIPYVNVSIEGNGANYIVQTSSMKSATVNVRLGKFQMIYFLFCGSL